MPDGVPMKDYVDLVGQGLQDEIDRRFAGIEKQIEISRAAMDARLHGMNDFRAALTDTTARMVSRDTLDEMVNRMRADHKRSDDSIDGINSTLAQMRGRQLAYASVIAAVVAVVSVIGVLANGSIIHIH